MDRGAWRATVHQVAKSRTQLKWLGTHSTALSLGTASRRKKRRGAGAGSEEEGGRRGGRAGQRDSEKMVRWQKNQAEMVSWEPKALPGHS